MTTNSQTIKTEYGVCRFCGVAVGSPAAVPVAHSAQLRVQDLRLLFFVSSDEEYVSLRVSCRGSTIDLGARAHNYLLLTLARYRLKDAASGLPDTACGWLCPDDISHDPMMWSPRLNVEICRIRKQFAACGVVDAPGIIERRNRLRQLRVGTGLVSVVRV
jgi:hypothetical protein